MKFMEEIKVIHFSACENESVTQPCLDGQVFIDGICNNGVISYR